MIRADGHPGSAVPNGLSLQSAAPVLLFLAVNRVAGLRWAVAIATAGSIALALDRRRKGLPLGRLMPLVTGAVIARGAIGVITGSETVYFGLGIATKYLVAAVLLGSVAAGAPLAKRVLPLLMRVPQEMAAHRVFHTTMGMVTAIAGLYYTVSASFDIWLFRRSSVEGYVLVRFLANWPLSAAALVGIMAALQIRLQKIPDMPPFALLIEERLNGAPVDPESSTTTSTPNNQNPGAGAT